MGTPHWNEVRGRLEAHHGRELPGACLMQQAAVAAIFRPPPRSETEEIELLFIRRAKNPRDPWSGHMAFPGGRVDAEDPHPRFTARRETLEEIGLNLDEHARLFGRLSQLLAKAHHKIRPLVITPYLFELEQLPALTLNEEVSEVIWIPLSFFLDEDNRSQMDYKLAGVSMKFPCYRYEGRVVWGLTLRMLDEIRACLTS